MPQEVMTQEVMTQEAPTDKDRCPQCWQFKAPGEFTVRGHKYRQCNTCREKYGDWQKLLPAERLARMTREDPEPTGRILFVRRSLNKKTGPIPTSMSERGTCPPSCSFYKAGCYALYGKLGSHWKRVGAEQWHLSWSEFLETVRGLRPGTIWRHNTAGDLQGRGDSFDTSSFRSLVEANRGKRGFTFTHKPLRTPFQKQAIREANDAGFTVNLSADTFAQADKRADEGIGPVAVVLPEDAPSKLRTPKGRHVIVCPAQRFENVTCKSCKLCALPHRKAIIGFRAHGQASGLIQTLVRRKQ
jgi:hypothetical protein